MITGHVMTVTVSNGKLAGPASSAHPWTTTMVSAGCEWFLTQNSPIDAIIGFFFNVLMCVLFNLQIVNKTSLLTILWTVFTGVTGFIVLPSGDSTFSGKHLTYIIFYFTEI